MTLSTTTAAYPASWLGLQPPIVVPEIGGNHNGDLGLALRMIDAVADAGASVAKFQVYRTSEWSSVDDRTYSEFEREELPARAWATVEEHCRMRQVQFLATPFDRASVDALVNLGVPAIKIASGDLTNLPFLRYVAATRKPVLLSTGASCWGDIDIAVDAIRAVSDAALLLLHCTAAYPAVDAEANLRVIPAIAERYGCQVGFSDHTPGIEISLAAVALGAVLVEKHFTTDRSLPGGDNAMSILPGELGALVEGTYRVRAALGCAERKVTESEQSLQVAIRRSLALRRPLAKGEIVLEEDLVELRPGSGISAGDAAEVTGRTTRRALPAQHVLHWDDLT